MHFIMVFDFTHFWLNGRPGNEYFWLLHKISGLLTPLGVRLQWFKTDLSHSSYSGYNQGSLWLTLKETTNASATENWGWCDKHCHPHYKNGHYHSASKLQVARVDILDDPDCVSFNLKLQFYNHRSKIIYCLPRIVSMKTVLFWK